MPQHPSTYYPFQNRREVEEYCKTIISINSNFLPSFFWVLFSTCAIKDYLAFHKLKLTVRKKIQLINLFLIIEIKWIIKKQAYCMDDKKNPFKKSIQLNKTALSKNRLENCFNNYLDQMYLFRLY